jgi:hypothetical protein
MGRRFCMPCGRGRLLGRPSRRGGRLPPERRGSPEAGRLLAGALEAPLAVGGVVALPVPRYGGRLPPRLGLRFGRPAPPAPKGRFGRAGRLWLGVRTLPASEMSTASFGAVGTGSSVKKSVKINSFSRLITVVQSWGRCVN